MKQYLSTSILFILILCLFTISKVDAQDTTPTSDDLLIQAKDAAKDKTGYPKAIELLKKALVKSPDYADIRIYLGRLYTWTDKVDSARYQFNQVLARELKNSDAISANFDVEYWNDNYSRALDHANMGLLYYPDSSEFVIKKAKALSAMQDSRQALSYLKDRVQKHPEQTDVTKYYQDLKAEKTKNAIDVSYEYVYFDKRFDDPWHYAAIDYTRNTGIGSITARLNYSNRFKTNALQGEIEAYPSITKDIYAYVGLAGSADDIFPRFRFGTSLYYTLPKGFDAETGFRYLDYNPTKTYIFVLAAGKYIGNYYINLKTYLSPDVDEFSHSYTLSVKYYLSDRFNVIGAQIGTGISPDDRARNITGIGTLSSYKFGLNFSKDLVKNLTISLSGLWYYEEYFTSTWGNQISGGISLSRRF
jgi:YaiO family outer membrane protein